MGIFSTIKKWLTGGSTNSKIKSANRTSYYGGGVSSKRTQTQIKQSISAAKKKQEEEQKEKQEQLNSAFKASTYKVKTIAETRGKSEEKKAEKPDVFNKKNAYKATPPSTRRSTALGGLSESDIKTRTAKKAAADANRKEQLRTAERLKPLIDEKYGRRKSGVPTYVKQGNYAADPDVAKYNVLKHPVATSATRGAVSGTTFGLSELAIQKAPKSKEAAEAERFYQANKSKGAEFAGEMAGSIAGFGLTGNLSKNAVSKVFPKATAKIGASATERLATNKFVLQAAEREALKTFGKTFTEKELAQLARAKAAKIVAAVGEDMAINLTTGAVSDVAHALIDSKDPTEFAKNMAINAGMNVALGGLTTVAPELFRGSELQNSMRAMGDDAVGFGRDVARNMDNKSGGIKISNGDVPPKNEAVEKTLNDLADKIEPKKSAKKVETIASGKNWRSGEDIALWKDGNTLYVGNPNGDFKSFGKDLPENRIKAEDEFDYYNNTRRQQLREARGEKPVKSKESKPKTEERPRPDGVKKYTDKQLLDMKKNGNLNQLSRDEYTYYIYDRPENDPFFEKWDAIDNNGKTVKKTAKVEEPKAEQPKVEQAKAEEPKSEKPTKTLTKKQLENKKKRSDKRLKQIEEEIKKSPYASQYEQDALSAKYTKELEYRKKLDERIKEAEASADGTITVSKGKKKAAKEVDESNVTVTKGKEELVEEPPKPKKEKKKKQNKAKSETKAETKVEAQAEAKAEEPKPSKKVTSLENKIRNSDEKIDKFKKQIAEKKKEGASEKSIANLEAQRKAEMERRKGFKKELKELTGSSEVSKKVEPPKAEAKAETEIKTTGNKKVDSLENRVAYANDNIDKFKKTLKEKKANGASEKSIAYTEKQLAKEKARLKEIKKELTAAKKEAEAKASKVDVEKLFKEQEKERYAVAGKSTKELKKQLADLQDDLKVLSDEIDSPREIPIDELRRLEYEHQLKSELYDTVNDELHSRNPAKDVLKKDTEVKPPKKEKTTKSAKAKEAKADVKVEASEKSMTKAAQARAKKEAAKQRLDVLLESVKEKQAAYDGGDANALKELVSLEKETKQAYRDAGMSRADEYKEAKKLFDKHDRALKRLENKGTKPAAETLKTKAENTDVLETYKKNQKASIEQAKAEEQNTVDIGNKTYSAVDESPFDEASTRTTREKPKFTPKEEAADQTAKKPKQKTKNAEGKAKQSEQKSGKAEGKSKKQKQQSEERISQGQKEARAAYEKETGQKFEKDAKPATDEQIYDAIHKYEVSQGTDHKRKLSKAASSQVRVSDTDSAKIIDNLMANTDVMEYETISHRGMYEEVAKDLNEDWDRWIDKINDVADNETWDGKEGTKLLYMSQYLSEITDATKSPEQAVLAEQAWKAIKTLSSSAGQTLNGRRTYVKLSKAAKMESAVDDLVHILDDAVGFNKKHKAKLAKLNKYERRHYIKGQIMSDPKVKECVLNLSNAKTEDAVSEAYAKLLVEFNKLNPKTGFDVIQEVRYMNMLLNPKTHGRNMFGSSFFSPMRKISNAIRAGIEDSLAEKAGVEITKHGGLSPQAMMEAWSKKPKTEAGKSAQEAFERLKSDILGSSKYDTPMYKGRAKTIAGKALDTVADFNSHLLSVEDDFFKSRAFKENYIKSYNRYLKDGIPITDKIKRQIEAESIQEAKIATFNEYNEFAKWLSDIERNASNANATSFQRGAGVAVNAVMPFTKVPANLMKQSINYSPIGLAKGYVGIKDAIKKQDAKALNKAIDELASGATGTTVFMLGTLLGLTSDRIKTNVGKKDYASKFEKQQGVQNYSVTLGEGDKQYSVTLDWLVPMSSVFFSGVEFADQFKENGLSFKGIGSAVTDWATVVSRLAEPVMETSMLSGLHGMLETMRSGSDSDDTLGAIAVLGRETVQSWINSMVPTALGQIARTAYSTDKMVGGVDDWDYFKNSLKNKTGLAADNAVTRALGIEPLGADTDAYGNIKGEKKDTADYLKSAVKNMLSPANIQKVDLSELDKQKIAEYRSRVKAGEDPSDLAYLFPKKQYKREFTVGDMDVKLSNKDLSTYNQAKTTGGEEGMRYVLEGIMFNRPTVDASGKKVPSKDAYTQEEKAALMKKFEGKSMREVEEWLYAQPQFKNASDAEKRKVINGLWSYSNQGKSNASKRVGEQAVVKAQGGDVNEYNFKNELSTKRQENLQAAIDKGIVTYEEAVDFARYAGKTYYYENDEGGTASTFYNKKQMLEYLESKGYSHDKAEALFNAFKAANAKPYGSASGRRRWGGWHRWGRHGGGGSKKSKIKTGSFKPSTVHPSKGGSSSTKTPKTSVSVKSTSRAGSGARSANAGTTTKATMPKASATPKVAVPTTRRRGASSSGAGTGSRRGTASASSVARARASGGTTSSIRVNRPTTSSRTSTNVKRSQTRVNSTPKMAVTPLNIKTVKASKSRKSTNTSLAAALKDLENTQKKVAPPKARRK